MRRKQRTILLIAAILAIATIIFAILYSFSAEDGTQVYRQSMERAELYYNLGDYEEAVLHYKAAIEKDEKQEEAYDGLADAYIALGDLDNAIFYLELGYKRTGITRLHDRMLGLVNDNTAGTGSTLKKGVVNAEINFVLIERIGGSSYSDYVKKDAPVSVESLSDGSVHVRFAEVPGIMVFRNSDKQPAAVDGDEISDNAIPEEVMLDDIADLLGKIPMTRGELEEMGVSNVMRKSDPVHESVLQFSIDGCTVMAECDQDDTIQEGAYNTIIPSKALSRLPEEEQTEGISASGSIIDAQSGDPVGEITLRFFDKDGEGDEPLAEVVTGPDGHYEVSLPPDEYLVEASGDGYETGTYELEIEEDNSAEEDFVISKELVEGEIRIVLEWGSVPSDLDSHLIGETDSGTDVHIFFSNKKCSDDDGEIAELDLDDTSAYGPETTTIHNINGKYEFSVHNYIPSTGNIEESEATVTLYLPNESPKKYSIGSDGEIDGVWWHVFTLDHGRVE